MFVGTVPPSGLAGLRSSTAALSLAVVATACLMLLGLDGLLSGHQHVAGDHEAGPVVHHRHLFSGRHSHPETAPQAPSASKRDEATASRPHAHSHPHVHPHTEGVGSGHSHVGDSHLEHSFERRSDLVVRHHGPRRPSADSKAPISEDTGPRDGRESPDEDSTPGLTLSTLSMVQALVGDGLAGQGETLAQRAESLPLQLDLVLHERCSSTDGPRPPPLS